MQRPPAGGIGRALILVLLFCAAIAKPAFAQPSISAVNATLLNQALPATPAITAGANVGQGFSLNLTGGFVQNFLVGVDWVDNTTGVTTSFSPDGQLIFLDNAHLRIDIPTTQANALIGLPTSVTLRVVQSNGNATFPFTVNPPPSRPASLTFPTGTQGFPYSTTFFNGGTGLYVITVTAGSVTPTFPYVIGNPAIQVNNLFQGIPQNAGNFTFTVVVADAWDSTTTFTVDLQVLPPATLTSPVPASASAGTNGIATMTLNGSNFITGSFLQWTFGASTTPLTALFVSANQLTASIPAGLLAVSGTAAIRVQLPNGFVTPPANFPINGPSIGLLNPSTAAAGTGGLLLTVNGANFVNNVGVSSSTILFGGTPLTTAFVNSNQLTASVPAILLANPATPQVQVQNPGGALSAAIGFPVNGPSIGLLNPNTVAAGSGGFLLTVNGANFVNNVSVTSGVTASVIFFDGTPLPTVFVNSNQLTANVPGNLITNARLLQVQVQNPGGALSAPVGFPVTVPVPTPLQITTQSPLNAAVTGTAYTMTIVATGGRPGYTFSVPNAGLPPGMRLLGDGTLTGTPATAGVYFFTVLVVDEAGTAVSKPFSLTVADQLLITTASQLSDVAINTAVNVPFKATGGTLPYTWTASGGLAPGTQVTKDGVLTGTATTAGTYTFTVGVTDNLGASARQNFRLTVTPPSLTIVTSSLGDGQVGSAYSARLVATGGREPYSWSATGTPDGLSVSSVGVLAGTPTAAGSYTLSVTVTDAANLKAVARLPLKVVTAPLLIATASLANGVQGTPYSASVVATGGTTPYTFSATGLPAGLTISADGAIGGTPTTVGPAAVIVKVIDKDAATVSKSFDMTIAPPALIITTASPLADAIAGTAYSATLIATGGVSPYTWTQTGAPAGITLSTGGVLSGTTTATGSFTIAATVKDNAGTTAARSFSLTVGLPATPPLLFTGVPATGTPATQSAIQVRLGTAYPVDVTARLTLTFRADSGADDPAVQFAGGGRTSQALIPAGSTNNVSAGSIQTGTVAGTITIVTQLAAATQDVTPSPPPTQTIRIAPGPPTIVTPNGVTAVRNATGLTVTVVGFSTPRQVTQAVFVFSAATGANLQTGTVTVAVDGPFTQWYASTASVLFGSQFTLTQPFTVQGSPSSIVSVSVTLVNSLGTSNAVSANFQ
jgi:hypothetical protein